MPIFSSQVSTGRIFVIRSSLNETLTTACLHFSKNEKMKVELFIVGAVIPSILSLKTFAVKVIRHLPYHAGLDKEARERNQDAFLNDETKIMVATIAFGMGIDKSNVRFVVHMDLPKNIESYYQETGRAGHDGLPSEALLFFSLADVVKLKGFAEVEGDKEQSRVMLRKLDRMGEYGCVKGCRRRFLLSYFSEEMGEDCGNCDNCGKTFEKFDGTIVAQKALSVVVRTGSDRPRLSH